MESEYISRPHLDIVSAHSKFKEKTLVCGKGLDFSDRIRRKRNTGYEAISGDWEIAAEGEKETIIQRYNRLQCEIKALIEDINKVRLFYFLNKKILPMFKGFTCQIPLHNLHGCQYFKLLFIQCLRIYFNGIICIAIAFLLR